MSDTFLSEKEAMRAYIRDKEAQLGMTPAAIYSMSSIQLQIYIDELNKIRNK